MGLLSHLAVRLTERGLVPDGLIRQGIRSLVRERLREIRTAQQAPPERLEAEFIAHMSGAVIAPVPDRANAQHYEVPAEFFQEVLGPHLKYSCALWSAGVQTLAGAEAAALTESCARAGLEDGQRVLELGCGWGSLTLWMAARYPNSVITAVSNSRSQREYVLARADQRGLRNVRVDTCDVNHLEMAPGQFDRIVSIEMFEHMRNWPALFARVHRWLRPGGLFFMHIFAHRAVPYLFTDRGPSDWMSRYFFTGGMMPSDRLPLVCQDHLRCIQRWRWDGTHYERTANAWLANMDAARATLWPVLDRAYGQAEVPVWWMRWRMFFMACAELFGYARGDQWGVNHYLFEKPRPAAASSA